MTSVERAFQVTGPDGLVRRGVLTLPERPSGIGMLLLPAGLKYRIGPGRLNVVIARRLAEAGCITLRFDPLGIGESDGRLPSATTAELWNAIALGSWIDDAVLAARELRERLPVTHLVVGGLCGGAVTGQLAAARHPELFQGVLSLGTAVTLPSPDDGPRNEIVPSVAQHHVRSYIRKLTSLEAWRRVFRAESDFRGIFQVLRAQALHWLAPRSLRAVQAYPNENPLFFPSFARLQTGNVPHLLLFGTSDNRWLEFQAAVLGPRLSGAVDGPGYEVRLIADANHEVFLKSWKDAAVLHVQQWVQRQFGATGDLADAPTAVTGIELG